MVLITANELENGQWEMRFPFHRGTVDLIKEIPGARWSKADRVWYASVDHLAAIEATGQVKLLRNSRPRQQPVILQSIADKLRPYQLDGAIRLASNPGFLLTFDPRVGKTPTSIAALSGKLASGAIRRAFIAFPAGVAGEWHRQLSQWAGLPMLQLEGVTNFDPQYIAALRAHPYLIVGCQYEALLQKREKDLLAIFEGDPFAIIGDEIQKVKNRKAPTTQTLLKLAHLENCIHRWGLTGTPMRNRPRDIWAMFEFVYLGSMGGYWSTPKGETEPKLGGYWNFAKRYCNPPEAPIWMGDFSFKPLGDVRVGDEVIGWERAFGRRSKIDPHGRDVLRRATVLAINRRQAPLVKVTMASGRQIRCTPDHLWLADNNAQSFVESPRNIEIQRMRKAGAQLEEIADKYGLSVQSVWRIANAATFAYLPARVGRNLIHVVETKTPYLDREFDRLAGWVGGMYDGEGSGNFISQSSRANPETWKRLGYALSVLGIPHSLRPDTSEQNAGGAHISGGRDGFLRFLKICQPSRRSRWDETILTGRFKKLDKVIAIEDDGFGEVLSMTTTTGNYVAWGYASKNCAAYQGSYGWVDDGSSNEDELKLRLEAVSYRLTRAQVASYLPKADRRTILCEMSASARRVYNAREKVLGASIAQALNSADIEGPTGKALQDLATQTVGSKLDTAIERLQYHCDERKVKVLVFANFHESLNMLWEKLEPSVTPGSPPPKLPLEAPVFCAGGWLLPDKRKKVIEQWRACAGPAVLLANTIASGIGIDLSDAEGAIFIEQSWVPADFRQAEDRVIDVHQGKRSAPPWFEYLLVKQTIDEDMALALLKKVRNIEAVVGGDAELTGMASTLRGSGVVERTKLGLASADPEVVAEAIASFRSRLFDDDTEEPGMSNNALAIEAAEAFDEGESNDETDAD